MPGERIVFDGLWRCLCPSIDTISRSKPSRLPRISRQRPSLPRCYTTSSPQAQCRREYRRIVDRSGMDQRNDHESVEQGRVQYIKRLAKRSPWIPGALFEGYESFVLKLERIPTSTIYAALQELPDIEGTYFSVVKLVEYLVRERNEKPNAQMYESLIRANVDKRYGSAEVAGRLLKEMENHNIPTTMRIYQGLLDVTAVHPDYVLRSSVLLDMKNRWYSPTADDITTIILGHLRDKQYELALGKLEEMNKDPIEVPPWLFDIFLYTFAELGFHEETLQILKHRLKVANAVKQPLALDVWQFALEAFARDSFYPGIRYIWDRSVSPGYLNPPDGVTEHILNAASRHGDAALVVSAIQMLSNRRKLDMHHYEALVDVHCLQREVRKALTILCIMAKAGLSPDSSSTRSIYQMLRALPSATDKALEILHELRLHYQVPSAAFNVVLEATEVHRGFKVALDMYRSVRQICVNGPDIETYHLLFRGCTQRKSMNFLLAEMQSFSIKPTKTTYDHLIRVCTLQDSYEPAFRYLGMMTSGETEGLPGPCWMSKDSALALVRRLIQAEDVRVQSIRDECRSRGLSIDTEIQQLIDDIQKQKGSEEAVAEEQTSIPDSGVLFL